MENKNYFLLVGIVFSIIALLHLLRAVMRWDVTIETFAIPIWMSVLAFIAAGILAFLLFKKIKE